MDHIENSEIMSFNYVPRNLCMAVEKKLFLFQITVFKAACCRFDMEHVIAFHL
jgi:hypothetical protein